MFTILFWGVQLPILQFNTFVSNTLWYPSMRLLRITFFLRSTLFISVSAIYFRSVIFVIIAFLALFLSHLSALVSVVGPAYSF